MLSIIRRSHITGNLRNIQTRHVTNTMMDKKLETGLIYKSILENFHRDTSRETWDRIISDLISEKIRLNNADNPNLVRKETIYLCSNLSLFIKEESAEHERIVDVFLNERKQRINDDDNLMFGFLWFCFGTIMVYPIAIPQILLCCLFGYPEIGELGGAYNALLAWAAVLSRIGSGPITLEYLRYGLCIKYNHDNNGGEFFAWLLILPIILMPISVGIFHICSYFDLESTAVFLGSGFSTAMLLLFADPLNDLGYQLKKTTRKNSKRIQASITNIMNNLDVTDNDKKVGANE